MTIDEFIDNLKYTPRTWGIYDTSDGTGGSIRNAPPFKKGFDYMPSHTGESYVWPLCPITAVKSFLTGQISSFGSGGWKEDSRFLCLSTEDAQLIADAADGENGVNKNYDRSLRLRLLEACGLKEVE